MGKVREVLEVGPELITNCDTHRCCEETSLKQWGNERSSQGEVLTTQV